MPTPKPDKPDCQKLVEDNLGLVYHIAMKIHRILPVRQDLDDLIGYGMIGLVEAAGKYQAQRGIEFTTFAYPRINGAVYDGVSKLSWMSRSRYNRLTKLHAEAESKGDHEMAENAAQELVNVSSLDTNKAAQTIADEDGTDQVEGQMDRYEQGEILGRLIDELPNREKRLITMVYIEGMSLKDASARLGMSKSWGSRIHSRTLTMLTNQMNARNEVSLVARHF